VCDGSIVQRPQPATGKTRRSTWVHSRFHVTTCYISGMVTATSASVERREVEHCYPGSGINCSYHRYLHKMLSIITYEPFLRVKAHAKSQDERVDVFRGFRALDRIQGVCTR